MTPPTPTSPPASIVAGDTVAFTVSLSDYSAENGDTLVFTMAGQSILAPVDGAANGSGWDFTMAAAVTMALSPGSYRWRLRVTSGGVSSTVLTGETFVEADFAQVGAGSQSPLDETLIPIIKSALAGTLTGGMKMYMINGRQVQTLTVNELWDLLAKCEARRDARLSRGLRTGIQFGTRRPGTSPSGLWSC